MLKTSSSKISRSICTNKNLSKVFLSNSDEIFLTNSSSPCSKGEGEKKIEEVKKKKNTFSFWFIFRKIMSGSDESRYSHLVIFFLFSQWCYYKTPQFSGSLIPGSNQLEYKETLRPREFRHLLFFFHQLLSKEINFQNCIEPLRVSAEFIIPGQSRTNAILEKSSILLFAVTFDRPLLFRCWRNRRPSILITFQTTRAEIYPEPLTMYLNTRQSNHDARQSRISGSLSPSVPIFFFSPPNGFQLVLPFFFGSFESICHFVVRFLFVDLLSRKLCLTFSDRKLK